MSGTFFSLILNGIIIVLLGATIMYTARLSVHIKTFRDSRKDLDKLIKDLGKQIERAEQAIAAMRDAAKTSGRKLQDTMDKARALSDELQIMNESGNSVASRLEKGADRGKGRQKTAQREDALEIAAKARGRDKVKPSEPASAAPIFAIRDPELGRGEEDDQGLDETAFLNEKEGAGLQSKAERELYEALHKRRRTETGGVS